MSQQERAVAANGARPQKSGKQEQKDYRCRHRRFPSESVVGPLRRNMSEWDRISFRVVASSETVMDINPLRCNICTITHVVFFTVTDVTSRFLCTIQQPAHRE